MDYQTIIYATSDQVATITLHRPEKRNAANEIMGEELIDCLNRCNEDADVRAIILTGSGKIFCSGGDLESYPELADWPTIKAKKLLNAFFPAISEINRIDKPVIAAVNGPAIGGGFAIALTCDLVIAAKSAKFNSHYVLIGLSSDAGLSYYLPRIVGSKRAAWLMFTGETVDAQKGYELGFVNMVVEDAELMKTADELAKRLAMGATVAIGEIKRLLNQSWHEGLENQLENEKQSLGRLARTEDVKEALSAFGKKRSPVFKGR